MIHLSIRRSLQPVCISVSLPGITATDELCEETGFANAANVFDSLEGLYTRRSAMISMKAICFIISRVCGPIEILDAEESLTLPGYLL